jgi:hypothetical protein
MKMLIADKKEHCTPFGKDTLQEGFELEKLS